MSKNIWKNLRYKNVAVVLAIFLLIILIICASCSSSTPDVDPNAKKVQTITDNTSSPEDASSSLFASSKVTSLTNSDALSSGNLVVVNADHPLSKDLSTDVVSLISYNTDSDGNQLYSLTDSSVCVTESAARQLQSMMSDFYSKSKNSTLFVSSGYLASEAQESEPFEAGSNDVGAGLSLSLGTWSDGSRGTYDGTGDFEWITENMSKYGFVTRYTDEKSSVTGAPGNKALIRYVGLPHAEIMAENGFCLEEYIEFIKTYTYENPLQHTSSNSISYAVYYTEMKKGNTTDIKIPTKADGTEYTYAVSGNNIDGYIVTVAMEKTAAATSPKTDTGALAAENQGTAQTEASVFDAEATEAPEATASSATQFIASD